MVQVQLSRKFVALADPTRRSMLARHSKGEADVSDVANPLRNRMSVPAITKHLRALESAGLITKTHQGQRRPCKVNAAALKDVDDWVEQYRQFREESLDRLDEYLKTVAVPSTTAQKNAKGEQHACK